jgi:CRP-like cAMP-binding protein
MSPPNRINIKNRLLTALPQEDLYQIYSSLHPVPLSQRQTLHEAGGPMEHVYFVEQGVASVLTNMADGTTIEVGMIGLEGMAGVSALLGADVSVQLAIVQIPGTALRMSAARCRTMFDHSAAFRKIALRFSPKPC